MEGTKAQMNLNTYYSFQVLEYYTQALLFHTDILTFLSWDISPPKLSAILQLRALSFTTSTTGILFLDLTNSFAWNSLV